MSASLIPPEFVASLREIYGRLAASDIVWVVTGSLGLAIKGIPLTPHDIDIQTDREGVEAFARLFRSEMVEAPHFRESEHTRSWFAVFEINGIRVDVMGDVQHRDAHGGWESPPNLAANRIFIQVAEMAVPTLTLEFEEGAYRAMGRWGKAEWIRQYLRMC